MTQTVTSEQLDAVMKPYTLSDYAHDRTIEQLITAAARVRHAVEQGNGVARYESWRDMCSALDALGLKG